MAHKRTLSSRQKAKLKKYLPVLVAREVRRLREQEQKRLQTLRAMQKTTNDTGGVPVHGHDAM